MSNAINPNDYNLDKLNTGFLGPILTTNFRDYVLGHNLQNINPEVASHGYNLGGLNVYAGDLHQPVPNVQDQLNVLETADTPNIYSNGVSPWSNNQVMNLFRGDSPYSYRQGNNTILTSPAYQGKRLYTVTSNRIGNPGDVTSWKTGSGTHTAGEERNEMIKKSSYGPDFIYGYNCPSEVPQSTGYVQYKAFAGGDFRSGILGQQLGFGSAAGIVYDSPLNDIGKDQREFNIKERIKLNFIGDTLGSINADPLGLLAGQDLISKDYTITKPKGFLGKAAAFTASLVGFNIPTSILPGSATISREGYSDTLLEYTSAGQRSILYDSLIQNKWGPRLKGSEQATEEKTKVGKFISNLKDTITGKEDIPAMIEYTDPVTTDTKSDTERDKNLVDKLNKGVSGLVDKLMNQQEPPSVPRDPSPIEDPTQSSKDKGYEVQGYSTGYDDEKTNEDDPYSKRFKVMDLYGTKEPKPELGIDNTNLVWKSTGNNNVAKRGLLKHTQLMINSSLNDDSSSARFIGAFNDATNFEKGTAGGRHKKHSMGNTVKKEVPIIDPETGEVTNQNQNVYCRSWSIANTYSHYTDTIRHEKLRRDEVFSNLSVLEDNGMPKIVPYLKEYEESLHSTGEPSKYMLSIENLAWQNTREFNALPNIEKGPHGGRLMWFPPYDINFTDNSSVNWDTTQFIGRGEPIYTYNSTERTGNLSFTILTDHSSSLATIRKETEVSLEQYFAGCGDLKKTAFGDITNDEEDNTDTSQTPVPIPPPTSTPASVTFYFQNASTTANPGRDVQTDIDACYLGPPPCATAVSGGTNLNATFQDSIDTMVKFLISEEGKRYKIEIDGYASALNVSSYNLTLSEDRAKSLRQYLWVKLSEYEDSVDAIEWPYNTEGSSKTFPNEQTWQGSSLRWRDGGKGVGEQAGSGADIVTPANTTQAQKEAIINDPLAVQARKAVIKLVPNLEIDSYMEELSANEVEEENKKRVAAKNLRKEQIDNKSRELANQMVNESTYFNKLQVENSFIYDSLKEKMKFFHPAFHSMTPEGMNSRLTFLKQCTRQGPSVAKGEPQNMAFGKPPICVLRIGDFYHTKIVIDTVNYTFEPLQWDLNPEGIGVQPMIAKVDLNFKFIGGSSLGGPIDQLQNAVSFNFFANTSVYNRRKDIVVAKDEGSDSTGKGGVAGIAEVEKFGYGSFITPEQVNSGEGVSKTKVDLRTDPTLDLDPKKDNTIETEGKPQDAEGKKTDKAVAEIDEGGDGNGVAEKAKESTDPTNWVVSKTLPPVITTTSTTLSIKDEEKDNWDIISVGLDFNYGDGAEEGSESDAGRISSDKKTATYDSYEDDVREVKERGNYTYNFTFIIQNKTTSEQTHIRHKINNKV
jgi:hypothetical protein